MPSGGKPDRLALLPFSTKVHQRIPYAPIANSSGCRPLPPFPVYPAGCPGGSDPAGGGYVSARHSGHRPGSGHQHRRRPAHHQRLSGRLCHRPTLLRPACRQLWPQAGDPGGARHVCHRLGRLRHGGLSARIAGLSDVASGGWRGGLCGGQCPAARPVREGCIFPRHVVRHSGDDPGAAGGPCGGRLYQRPRRLAGDLLAAGGDQSADLSGDAVENSGNPEA